MLVWDELLRHEALRSTSGNRRSVIALRWKAGKIKGAYMDESDIFTSPEAKRLMAVVYARVSSTFETFSKRRVRVAQQEADQGCS